MFISRIVPDQFDDGRQYYRHHGKEANQSDLGHTVLEPVHLQHDERDCEEDIRVDHRRGDVYQPVGDGVRALEEQVEDEDDEEL